MAARMRAGWVRSRGQPSFSAELLLVQGERGSLPAWYFTNSMVISSDCCAHRQRQDLFHQFLTQSFQ